MKKRFDPRTLFFVTFMYIILLTTLKNYRDICIIVPFLILHISIFSIKLSRLFQVIRYSITLFLSIIFVNYFIIGRDIEYIIVLLFKFIGIIFITVALVSTIDIDEIGFAIESFLSPLKLFNIKVESISLITALGMKFIPILQKEGERIYLAQKARGFDFELMSFREKVKSVFNLFFPVIISGIQHAFKIAIAMEVRGYGANQTRTRLKEYKLKTFDYTYMIFIIILMLVFVFRKI